MLNLNLSPDDMTVIDMSVREFIANFVESISELEEETFFQQVIIVHYGEEGEDKLVKVYASIDVWAEEEDCSECGTPHTKLQHEFVIYGMYPVSASDVYD